MNRRVRVSSLGGAALAAIAATLLGAPAASAHTDTPGVTDREVGASVGSLPVQAGASVAVPGWLLLAAPENLVAVPGLGGQDLLRLQATRVYTKTEAPTMGGTLGVIPKAHEVAATAPASVDAAGGPAAVRHRAPAAPERAPRAAAADLGEVALPRITHENEGVIGWVPIGGLSSPVGGSSNHVLGGLAALAVAGGAAAVVVVRRRVPLAG